MSMRSDPTAETPVARPSPFSDARGVAVVMALVVVLIAALWFFLLRGDGEPEGTQDGGAPAPAAPAAQPPAAPAPLKDKKGGGERSFQVFAPRDPFDPLVSATATGATTGTETQSATVGDSGAADEIGSAASGGGGSGTTVGSHSIEVIDVYRAARGPRAQIELDGTVYTVAEGDTFGDGFRLVSTSGRCATMTTEDGDRFTGCEGEAVLK
jgi:hypothetical protein